MTDPRVQRIVEWAEARRGDADIEVGPDTDLVATGLVDSLGFVSLFFLVETMGGRTVDLTEVMAAGPITPASVVRNWM